MIVQDHRLIIAEVENSISNARAMLAENLAWLKASMHPYFFFCNSEDIEEVAILAANLHLLEAQPPFHPGR